jgi:hypothetical protein
MPREHDMNAISKIVNNIISKFAPNFAPTFGIAPDLCCDEAPLQYNFEGWADGYAKGYDAQRAMPHIKPTDADRATPGFMDGYNQAGQEQDEQDEQDYHAGECAGYKAYPRYEFDKNCGKSKMYQKGYAAGWVRTAMINDDCKKEQRRDAAEEFTQTRRTESVELIAELVTSGYKGRAFANVGYDVVPVPLDQYTDGWTYARIDDIHKLYHVIHL